MTTILRFILLFLPVFSFAQQAKYDFIMKNVTNNIFENYDTIMYFNIDYNEFVYIDSTKNIILSVNMNTLSKKSQVFYSKHKDIHNGEYLYSGTVYEKNKNYGYSDFIEMMYGTNAYLSPQSTLLSSMHSDAVMESRKKTTAPKNKKIEEQITNCAIYTKLKEKDLKYEVKDTVYNSTNCYLLIKKQNLLFILDNAKRKNMPKKRSKNWDTCYQTAITMNIVNKSDYAILYSNWQTSYTNPKNEIRKGFMISKYEKTGNRYYEKTQEFKYPRRFVNGYQDGFNDRDLYTLIIREATPVNIRNPQENLKHFTEISQSCQSTVMLESLLFSQKKYKDFLKTVHAVDDSIVQKWKNYWKM